MKSVGDESLGECAERDFHGRDRLSHQGLTLTLTPTLTPTPASTHNTNTSTKPNTNPNTHTNNNPYTHTNPNPYQVEAMAELVGVAAQQVRVG